MRSLLVRLAREETGEDLIEYGLLAAFVATVATTVVVADPLGVKGCGEAGAIGSSAAVINAITDAIGNNKLEMPATPDRVWHAIHG